MTVVGRLVQHIDHPRLQPGWVILRQAERLGDPVSSLEADPEDIPRQAVWISPYHLQRLGAVVFVDFHCQSGSNAMTVQEQHDILDLLLLFPGGLDAGQAFASDIEYLQQFFWARLDHLQRAAAEGIYNPFRQSRPDPFHQSGAQVAPDPIDRGGQDLLACLGLELHPVGGMLDPIAAQPQVLSRGQLRQVPGDGHQSIAPDPGYAGAALCLQAHHAVSVFRVIVGDPFD